MIFLENAYNEDFNKKYLFSESFLSWICFATRDFVVLYYSKTYVN